MHYCIRCTNWMVQFFCFSLLLKKKTQITNLTRFCNKCTVAYDDIYHLETILVARRLNYATKKQLSLVFKRRKKTNKSVHTNAHIKYNKLNVLFTIGLQNTVHNVYTPYTHHSYLYMFLCVQCIMYDHSGMESLFCTNIVIMQIQMHIWKKKIYNNHNMHFHVHLSIHDCVWRRHWICVPFLVYQFIVKKKVFVLSRFHKLFLFSNLYHYYVCIDQSLITPFMTRKGPSSVGQSSDSIKNFLTFFS